MASPVEKILVRGVNWLGDAVMSTPALLRLREARPAAHIALLGPHKLAALWTGHPALDEILSFAPDEGVVSLGRRLARRGFTSALVLPNSPRSALEMFLARIPRRIGYARPWRNWFLTDIVAPRPAESRMHKRSEGEIRALIRDRMETSAGQTTPPPAPSEAHHIFQYLHLVQTLGARGELLPPLIAVTHEEVEAVQRRFGKRPQAGLFRRIGLNPGAEYGPAKRWPADRFAAVAASLAKTFPCEFWLLGGPADRTLAESIARQIQAQTNPGEGQVRVLAGQTTLRELCAALKACDVVVTNDTGPMHVAAAVGTPVVVPFGSTSPRMTGPGVPGAGPHQLLQATAPCSPCFRRECPIDFRCMTGITVERVRMAVEQAWARPH